MAYTPTSPKPVSDGIDLAVYQGTPNWDMLKSEGVKFAILRAGYGDAISYPGQYDSTFERNYKECKRVGIPVGAYWYAYATNEQQAVQEAKSFVKALAGKQLELPVLYDVEEMRIFNTGRTNEISIAFFDYMESLKYFTGLYIYRAALQSYINDRVKERYCLAVAEYGPKLNYDGPVGFWQNASTVRYQGINKGATNVDHDYMYVDYPAIIKSRGKNGFPEPKTTEKPKKEVKPTPTPKKSNEEIADEVIAGKWGAGDERRKKLLDSGYDYKAIQSIVNVKMFTKPTYKKSIDDVAHEVILGKWGAGVNRRKKLIDAGYDYDEVQARADALLKK